MSANTEITQLRNADSKIHTQGSFTGIIKDCIRDWQLYAMLAVVVIWYLLFVYRPIYGLQIAFKDYNTYKGIWGSPWVGLRNFMEFFQSPYFGRTIRNTLIINIYSLLFEFPAPIILALLLNDIYNVKFKKIVQTLSYLPYFISIVVIAGLVINFLSPSNGIINLLVERLGGDKVYYLSKKEYFRTIFISMNIWKGVGFASLVYIGALSAIDTELYEAAKIDGANKFKQLWHVTLPGIMPTIIIMLIMRLGTLLAVGYEAIILLYQPSTYETADVLSTFMYRTGLVTGNYDIAAAVGLFESCAGFILVVIANYISKRVSKISLW